MKQESKPLEDDKLIEALQAAYAIEINSIEFLPLGYDMNAAVYRLEAKDGQAYFLKVKHSKIDAASVQLPHFLKSQGIEQVIPPIMTIDGKFYLSLADANLILYPFIEGESGMSKGLTANQWRELGRTLKRIHNIDLPPELAKHITAENFLPHPESYPLAKHFHTTIPERTFEKPSAQELAAVWLKNYEEISLFFERTEALSQELQSISAETLLCHSDIHSANLFITPNEELFIVDWDQPRLAAKECDFMFIMGDKVGGFVIDPEQEKLFFEGYGDSSVDKRILSYYRYERILQDIGETGRHVFLSDHFSEEDNQSAIYWFSRTFDPDGLAEMTHRDYES